MENGTNVSLSKEQQALLKGKEDQELVMGVRPEDIYLVQDQAAGEEVFGYQVEVKEMLGHEYVLYGNIGGADCTMRTSLNAVGRGDEELQIRFVKSKCHIFDKSTEERIF